MKDGPILIKVFSLTDASIAMYMNNKVGIYLESKQNLFRNGIFTNQNKPKIWEPFQMRKHANQEGSTLKIEQK